MTGIDKIIIAGPDAIRKEIARQEEIHARQVASYTNARPRARFAVAAHLTKTRAKLGRLNRALESYGEVPRTLSSFWPEKDALQAREGCDRCYCGCKYWENDRCIDCGISIRACLRDPEWVMENRQDVAQAEREALDTGRTSL